MSLSTRHFIVLPAFFALIGVHIVCVLSFVSAPSASAQDAVAAASTVATRPPSTTKADKANPTHPKKTKQTTPTSVSAAVEQVAVRPSVAGTVPPADDDDVWAKLRKCESGGRYDINTGNGFYGAYQFAVTTWRRLGYSGYPHEAAPAVQDEAARKLQAMSGWGQWPACSRKLGLR